MINKKASFEYEKISSIVVGIKLIGSEVKSIRNSNANLKGSFCYFKGLELFTNFHIAEYDLATLKIHEPTREKKLLLKRRELNKLFKSVSRKGLTIIPFKLFINDKGLIKLELWLAKGKNVASKKQAIKERDLDRDAKRSINL